MPPQVENSRPFLTAEWRMLAMVHYEIDPATLQGLVPRGTELDSWNGLTLVSIVGFLFLGTRVRGVPIPLHRDFEEVNLRFYVRRRIAAGWRRGVVFVREIVPRRLIAWTARAVYGENYSAVPMGHAFKRTGGGAPEVSYWWRFAGRRGYLRMVASGEPRSLVEGTEEHFLAEHYWGYVRHRDGETTEYRVDHVPWRIWTAGSVDLDCAATDLYGPGFAEALAGTPHSAFLADGSPVTVYRGERLAQG